MQKNINAENAILQYGRVVHKNCCVVFPALRFPYLILCLRQCKGKVTTTYLAIKTKNNQNIREQKSAAVKTSTNYKNQGQTLRSLRKNKNNNFIIFTGSISR